MAEEEEIGILSLEDYEIPEDCAETVENTVVGSIRYGFVGLGQAGGRLAAVAHKLGYCKAIALNTSPQDLKALPLPEDQKLLIDIGESGAGKNPERGEEAVTKRQQDIYNLMKRVFGKHVDHVMLAAGSGGGTGGGAIIPTIMIAKRYLQFLGYDDVDKRVGAILTLPTNGEAASMRIAMNSISVASKISELADSNSITPLIILDNDRVQKLYPRLTMANFWPTVNEGVIGLFDIFNRLSLRQSNYTSFDPADYAAVIRSGGHTVMGVTSVKKEQCTDETTILKVVRDSIDKTLLADGFDFSTATSAAGVIVGGTQTLAEVPGLNNVIEYLFSMIANMTSSATIHRGVYEDTREGLRLYTIISGMKCPEPRYKKLRQLSQEKYP